MSHAVRYFSQPHRLKPDFVPIALKPCPQDRRRAAVFGPPYPEYLSGLEWPVNRARCPLRPCQGPEVRQRLEHGHRVVPSSVKRCRVSVSPERGDDRRQGDR